MVRKKITGFCQKRVQFGDFDVVVVVVVVVVDSSANITLAVSSWCFFELCFL